MVTLQELRAMVLEVLADNKTHTRQELITKAQEKFDIDFYDADQRTTSAIVFLLKKGALAKLEKGVYQLQCELQETKASDHSGKNLPEQTAPNTLLGLMRSGVSFYNVILRSTFADDPGFDCTTMYKCINNQIQELSRSTLEKHDLSEWVDVLTAPIEKLSPGRHNMTFILRDIDEQRVADFAEVMTGYEAQEKALTQNLPEPQQWTHMPY